MQQNCNWLDYARKRLDQTHCLLRKAFFFSFGGEKEIEEKGEGRRRRKKKNGEQKKAEGQLKKGETKKGGGNERERRESLFRAFFLVILCLVSVCEEGGVWFIGERGYLRYDRVPKRPARGEQR